MRKIVGIIILAIFYAIYLGKLLVQRKKGIKTDQIARGKRKDKVFYVEVVLKITTYSVVAVEICSILLDKDYPSKWVIIAGCIIGMLGDFIFGLAVFTMKDSWRAGLAEDDKTEMVTDGIYKYSRNPAFLGFDLVYISILMMFFNWILFVFSMFAVIMLHIQILQEEAYLKRVFGADYTEYKSRVGRYFGKKQ